MREYGSCFATSGSTGISVAVAVQKWVSLILSLLALILIL